jgi:glycosyltransferase involved in cell wall biosynthesis
LHQAGSYGKAVVMPDLGDLSILVKEEGYRGAFFDPNSVDSLADAIEKLVVDEPLRITIAKANYKAAMALPMNTITDMYMSTFDGIRQKKSNKKIVVV